MLVKLAIRNVFRNPGRTMITLVSVILGTYLIVFAKAFVDGIDNSVAALQIKTNYSHQVIYQKNYERNNAEAPLENLIEEPAKIIQNVKTEKFVKNVTGRTYFEAELHDGVNKLTCLGLVIEPAMDEKVFKFSEYTKGDYSGIVIGSDLANIFQKKVGDSLTIVARTKYGAITAVDLTITGLLNTSNPEYDNNIIVISRAIAQDFLQLDNAVSELCIETNDLNKHQEYKKIISQKLPAGLVMESWHDKTADLRNLNKIRRFAFKLITGIILLIAAAGIANTILMATYERYKEIGILAALGFDKQKIKKLFIYEAILIGFIGSIAGVGLSIIIVNKLAQTGIDFHKIMNASGGTYPLAIVYFVLDWWMVLVSFLIGLSVSLISGLYPAYKIANLNICEALRTE